MHTETPYDDEYATCVSTTVSFRVMGDDLSPKSVTKLLGLQPTHTQVRGALPGPESKHPFKFGAWFLKSSGYVQSRDSRRHLDWLLQELSGRAHAIAELRGQGHLVDLCVYWESAGQGGPTLGPGQLAQLGELGIELWFDIYFAGRDSAG